MSALARVPVRRIVAAIADAAERFADADFPPRVQLLDRIATRTGYSVPVVEYALDQLFFSMTAGAIEAVISNELGSLDVLDGFAPRTGRPDAFARPCGTVCVISSRTTIGVAIVPAIFALCAKCDVVVKDREDALVAAFFGALAQELDEFSGAAIAREWQGSDIADLKGYDAIVAFGRDATLADIASRIGGTCTFAGFGSKASAGYIGRDALSPKALRAAADGAARDVVLYETEGCMSLHMLFVERGGAADAAEAAQAMAAAIERASVEFPPGVRSADASAGIANARSLGSFRAAGGSGVVCSDVAASYLLLLDPPAHEPPAFLPRTLAIHSVDSPSEAIAYVRRHELPIEAVAIAGTRDDIVNMALDMGAHRITSFGELQRPPLAGGHGGRARIADFVRWTTRE